MSKVLILKELQPDLPVLFTHIPKTGGSAITSGMAALFGPDAIAGISTARPEQRRAFLEECKAAGMDDHLVKPIDLERFAQVQVTGYEVKGSEQIAEDLMVAREIGATQVYLCGGQGLGLDVGLQAADVDEWLELLGEVIEEAGRLGVLAP